MVMGRKATSSVWVEALLPREHLAPRANELSPKTFRLFLHDHAPLDCRQFVAGWRTERQQATKREMSGPPNHQEPAGHAITCGELLACLSA